MVKASKKSAGKKSSGKRELIEPNKDKRYIKRDEKGRIKESDDQKKSLGQDVKKKRQKESKARIWRSRRPIKEKIRSKKVNPVEIPVFHFCLI